MNIKFENGCEAKINNVYCIGRNYLAHIKELNNEVETSPVVFLKTNTSISKGEKIFLPAITLSKEIHHEVEFVIYIKNNTDNIDEADALSIIGGYAIGLDLTARDLQNQAKKKGLPWTLSKSFKYSGWVSDFIEENIRENFSIELYLNGKLRQYGASEEMIFSLRYLISYLSKIYGLRKGDLIFTGTPEGVGKISKNDKIELILNKENKYYLEVV